MTIRPLTLSGRSAFAAAAVMTLFSLGPTWSLRAQQPVAIDQAGVEVQARGPLHEAFADASSGVTQPSAVVPTQPPEPINEVPPDVRPDDARAIWISGYWAWDDERNDFMWISGVWRVPPPNAVWVPGYWMQVDGGFQWISGFWADADAQQVQYLPSPPNRVMEQGPSSPSPGDDYFYIPGNWVYANQQYAWQPGYWTAYQNGWTWSNSYYRWTPSGYVYVPGRWDVPFTVRGWAFAPVMFQQGSWSRPNFYYRPSTALNVISLAAMLFARNNGWYYYGDYYGNNYAQRGYMPWYAYGGYRGGYNPMYGYESWSRRHNHPHWDRDVHDRFAEHEKNPQSRPPRDWKYWNDRMRDHGDDGRPRPPGQVASHADKPFVRIDENANVQIGGKRGVQIDATTKTQADQMAKHYRELREQRQQAELKARANVQAGTPQPGGRPQGEARVPGGFQLPRPPVEHRVARPIEGAPTQQPNQPPTQGQPRPNRSGEGRLGEGRPDDDRPKLPDRKLDIPRVLTPGEKPAQGTPKNPLERPEPMPRVERPQPQQPPQQQPQPQPKQVQPQPKRVLPPPQQPPKVQPPRLEPPKQARPDGGNRPPKIDVPRPQGGGERSPGSGKKEGGKKKKD